MTEEKNRALRATQEKSNLQHQLHRAEAELLSARTEIKRSTEEVAAQRERAKEFNTLKIAAQKKVAEYNAENSRLEVSVAAPHASLPNDSSCEASMLHSQNCVSKGLSHPILFIV